MKANINKTNTNDKITKKQKTVKDYEKRIHAFTLVCVIATIGCFVSYSFFGWNIIFDTLLVIAIGSGINMVIDAIMGLRLYIKEFNEKKKTLNLFNKKPLE